jgi:GNAT superfamily N-acetyltransferase
MRRATPPSVVPRSGFGSIRGIWTRPSSPSDFLCGLGRRVEGARRYGILARRGERSRGFVLNMYTEPAYRRRGLAKQVLESIIAWCREQGFKAVLLHASDAGRGLYEQMGFEPTNEMRLLLT